MAYVGSARQVRRMLFMLETVTALEFNRTCSRLLTRVSEEGVTIGITRRGRLVATLGPPTEPGPERASVASYDEGVEYQSNGWVDPD